MESTACRVPLDAWRPVASRLTGSNWSGLAPFRVIDDDVDRGAEGLRVSGLVEPSFASMLNSKARVAGIKGRGRKETKKEKELPKL